MDWRKAGVWVEHPNRVGNPVEFGKKLFHNGFRWVTIKIHDGMALHVDAIDALKDGWARELAEQKILVGGWGVLRESPSEEANLVNRLIKEFDLKHYIADAEGFHKGDWIDPDTGLRGNQNRSDVFVDRFRKLRPTHPAAFTTYGAPGGDSPLSHIDNDEIGSMHFRCWYRAKFRYLPQAYPNEFGSVYELDRCIQWARRSGWPLSLTHLVIGNYGGWGATDYEHRLVKAIIGESKRLSIGFSVFLGDYTKDIDYENYGRYIRKYWLAST